MAIDILVATHKDVRIPAEPILTPIFVGSSLHTKIPKNFQPDNIGENISELNPHFNELTAVYWAWKNDFSDVIGLAHYRRFFRSPNAFRRELLNSRQISILLEKSSVILPRKRRYYVETMESHYYHSHDPQGLDILKEIIGRQSPKYRKAFDKVMSARSAHMFNMFIMPRKLFNQYCEWVFPILFEIDHRIDYKVLEGNEVRAVGFVSELLMDVWIESNKLTYSEVPVYFVGNQHWVKKITRFLLNKVLGRKVNLNSHID